ncbi:type II secretion system minor pseudopilin GspK [Maricaulis parjimensis]|uniref:type II secretion system minor pseudopilin GspK n=1 Tax=Maricaulis parjimensis TaxID=144023 RepID=UPI00193A8F98|nr:type II secretion system minor pseudopilin GspK [Maricaulis parjimensis]
MRVPGHKESGASLVSALMLVTVMASLAVVLAGDLRFAQRRATNLQVRDQAYWYALGAREFSETLLQRAMAEPETALRPDAAWLQGERAFPIDRGLLTGRIRDGNNCFNLNSLVTPDGQGNWLAVPEQAARFEILMRALDIPTGAASRIAAQATDWIDTDTRPVASGGEDGLYAAYRTGNTLMVEREELLSLDAVTPDIYRRLADFVCTRPEAAPVPLNINTLQAEDWPLLSAVFDGELNRTAIEGILLERPQGGFASIEAFWALDVVRETDPDANRRSALGLQTRYFDIEIDVVHAGQVFVLSTLIDYSGGTLRRITQSYGSIA